MSSIVIALPKIEDARKIRSVLERHGFAVASVCSTASNALSSASELGSGVLIDLSKYGLTYEPAARYELSGSGRVYAKGFRDAASGICESDL